MEISPSEANLGRGFVLPRSGTFQISSPNVCVENSNVTVWGRSGFQSDDVCVVQRAVRLLKRCTTMKCDVQHAAKNMD